MVHEENFEIQKPKSQHLYSISAIYIFSIVFNVIFGAALLIYNLRTLNKREGIMPIAAFSLFHMFFLFLIISITSGQTLITFAINGLGAYVLHEFFWKKYIDPEINIVHKKIWKPLFIAILVSIPFIIVLFYAQ